jgi:hypothetical protein
VATAAASAANNRQQQQSSWRDKFSSQEDRTRMWKILSTAAIAMAVGRYYYAWYKHGLEVDALREKAKELDVEKSRLDQARLEAVGVELRRLRFSDAEQVEAMRVLRAVSVESTDVERAIDAYIVVETETKESTQKNNETGRF